MQEPYFPPEVLERIKGNKGELQLQRRGEEYELIYNGVFLMASYNGRGEQEMVRAALQPWHKGQAENIQSAGLGTKTKEHFLQVLIGGLGFGLGLREALASPLVAGVDLIELEEAVIRWNRGVLGGLNNHALVDPRVSIYQEDMVRFLQNNNQTFYHAIVMDTDNGPDWLSHNANIFLYSSAGTTLLKKKLLPGGTLSVWSAAPAPAYYSLLRQYFPFVREARVQEQTGLDSYYYLAFKDI